MLKTVSPAEAAAFIAAATFPWFQHFRLADGVFTPGVAPVDARLALARLPSDLTGMSVLDVGTSNGAVCFEAERRGAADVLGVDVAPEDFWGFGALREFLGARARYLEATLYELPNLVSAPFDVVFCFGVLYHLRHPLLGLDALRSITGGYAIIETEISDPDFGDIADRPVARFYRGSELNNDGSNWFVPTIACLLDWCGSAGFETELLGTFAGAPGAIHTRALVRAVPVAGVPEYQVISYDRPLQVTARQRWFIGR